MFKKTLNFSELKCDSNLAFEIADGDVYQILQEGQDVKVMMTQEYFFNLMARLEKAEGKSKATEYDPEKLMSDFEKRMNTKNKL